MTTPTSPTSGSNSSTPPDTSGNALTALSDNFNDFLSLLTTQLQNQDPSSPLDTNQFTSELVQFTGVEQQITTNTSLTSLIQATQGEEVIQATGVVGKTVTVTSPDIVLQNGSGSINFTTTSAEPVSISIQNASGTDIKDVSATSAAGANIWTWDGTDNSGTTEPDGSYKIVVTGSGSDGTTAAIPFTVNGTATGVTNNNGTVTLNVGALAVDFSDVVSVGN
jgi:flagellar basal-body rod modification protein FlgD